MLPDVIVPILTPFDRNGIDLATLGKQADTLAAAGIKAILLFGTTGETYAISPEEKIEAMTFLRSHVGQRLALLTGVTGTRQDEIHRLLDAAAHIQADAAVVMAPYYLAPTAAEVIQFYKDVGRQSAVPVIIYNYPGITKFTVDAETVKRIRDASDNVIGIKDTMDSLSNIATIIQDCGDGFRSYSGLANYYTANRLLGGAGVIAGLGNACPELFVRLSQAYADADLRAVGEASRSIATASTLFRSPHAFIAVLKAALHLLDGHYPLACRMPLAAVGPDEIDRIANVCKRAGILPGHHED